MSSRVAGFFARKLEKAGYKVNNARGDYLKFYNNLELSLIVVYVVFSVVSAGGGISEVVHLNYGSGAWETVTGFDIFMRILDPIIVINVLAIGKLHIKLLMLKDRVIKRGRLKLSENGRTEKNIFSDPIKLRKNILYVGYILDVLILVVSLLFCCYSRKKMFYCLIPLIFTIVSSAVVFVDEITENLIRRYEAEEKIFIKHIIT
ncbi:hypothetical protein AALB53_22495 [Lachnospiraceae bacterium 47-T17]